MNQMARFPQWGGQGTTDPVRQIIDRLFEGNFFLQGGSRDESSVVTSQWIPLVDIKEEQDRFILYADIPGVDPKKIDVQMDRGLLTIKRDRRKRTLLPHRAPLRELPSPFRAARQCRSGRHPGARPPRRPRDHHSQAPRSCAAAHPGRPPGYRAACHDIGAAVGPVALTRSECASGAPDGSTGCALTSIAPRHSAAGRIFEWITPERMGHAVQGLLRNAGPGARRRRS